MVIHTHSEKCLRQNVKFLLNKYPMETMFGGNIFKYKKAYQYSNMLNEEKLESLKSGKNMALYYLYSYAI